ARPTSVSAPPVDQAGRRRSWSRRVPALPNRRSRHFTSSAVVSRRAGGKARRWGPRPPPATPRRAGPRPGGPPPPRAPPPRGAAGGRPLGEQQPSPAHQERRTDDGEHEQFGEDALGAAVADQLVHLVADRLVLQLLERVPEPQLPQVGVDVAVELLVDERLFG